MNEENRDIDRPTPLRMAPKQEHAPTLFQQWTMLENIETELRDRIRRERTVIHADHDRRWVAITNEFNERISEEVAKLEKARDNALKELTAETQEKLRDHEILTQRMRGSNEQG
jgi:hypothetical protein